jgi:plastocyanin
MNANVLKFSAFVIFAVVLAACAPKAAPLAASLPIMTDMPTVSADSSAPPKVVDNTLNSKVEISIKGFAFDPSNITIKVGTEVTWTNFDSAPHNVVSNPGTELASITLSKGDSWSHIFNTAGTYPYFCSIHPSMTATITVVP